MSLSRRGFIKVMSSSVVATSLMACHSESENSASSASFEHGVASGDPLQTAVIIWTRVTTQSSQARVTWQVASKADFSDIVAFGEITTDSEKDFTVKADAKGLSAGQHYFYRFLCEGAISPTGQTKTLAQGELSAASLAVVSCSNYPAGYFNVYREIVNNTRKNRSMPFCIWVITSMNMAKTVMPRLMHRSSVVCPAAKLSA